MLKAKLVVVGGDAKAGEFHLKLPTVIGRGSEAGLTIPHALVSRAHSRVFERAGRLVVKDLGSLNGTFINNTKIEGEQILEPNQLLTLGNVTFRAVYQIGESINVSASDVVVNDQQVPTVAPSQNSDRDTVSDSDQCGIEADSDERGAAPALAVDSQPGSAFSEIDSFEPSQSGSLGRLSEVNSGVVAVQVRGPERRINTDKVNSEPVSGGQSDQPINENLPVADSNGTGNTAPDEPKPLENNIQETSSTDASILAELKIDTGQPTTPTASSIDGLPADDRPLVSFVGQIEDLAAPDQVDSVTIELGESQQNSTVDESRLGSFLRRLPK